MSNVSIAYPNRLLELNKLHQCDWVNNTISPLSNITTPILSETARTSDYTGPTTSAIAAQKHVSFGLSLKNLPYRTFGAVGLINHNLSTSAKARFSVFNEPPIAYTRDLIALVPVAGTKWAGGTVGVTITLTEAPIANLPTGTRIKFYACGSYTVEESNWFRAVVVSNTGTSLRFIYSAHPASSTVPYMHQLWYIGYDAGVTGKTESKLVNLPKWDNVWKRVYPSNSSWVTWRSTNIWRGCIEEEQRLAFTKISISFLTDANTGEQPTGSHLHIDINDTTETVDIDNYIELGRVFIGQYSQPKINPEYGSIEHGFIDNSEITTSNSGTEFYYEKAKSRTVSVQWNHLTEDEAFGSIYEASRSQGTTREVLYAYDVNDTGSYQYARSFIGRFTQLNAITQPNFGMYGASINLKEIL